MFDTFCNWIDEDYVCLSTGLVDEYWLMRFDTKSQKYEKWKRHREDGPALISEYHREWWINGVDVTKEVESWLQSNLHLANWRQWGSEEKILFKMKFV